MDSLISRRIFLGTLSASAAAPYLAGCGRSGDEWPKVPDGVTIGPFGADSTAEEVTEGLDLTGLTAVVTGANSGIGHETMRVLALRGAHVIGTGRTMEKARVACDSVEGYATPMVLELTDFDSVVACVEQIQELDVPIDMLICNAGIMALPELELVYGLEKQFVVNHLGHFILVNGLIDYVIAAPQGRVVMLASGASTRRAPPQGIRFDNLSGQIDYDPDEAYGVSKLSNVLFARELAQRLQPTEATANAVHPGVIMTNLGRHLPEWQVFVAGTLGSLFMKSIEQGAATTCYVATNPALTEVSGYFFRDCNPLRPGGQTENDELAAQLWEVSEELTQDYLL